MNVNLQHPVPVIFRQIRRGEAEQDEDFRETVQGADFGPETTCVGQIKWGFEQSLGVTRSGSELASDGYVVFRTADLRSINVTLNIGDKFIKFGYAPNRLERELYIVKLTPFAHYPDQGGAACVKAFFSDRQPSRGT